jgi:hypothetical protein
MKGRKLINLRAPNGWRTVPGGVARGRVHVTDIVPARRPYGRQPHEAGLCWAVL